MVDVFRGSPEGKERRIAIVRSRFNELITQRLLDGALEALRQQGVADECVRVYEVPGAIELPWATQRVIEAGEVDAVVCLGAVIQGETRHFDYVCRMAADGILGLQREHGIPISFGVLTCETMEQALARSGSGGANRGFDAALVALELAGFAARLDAGESP